MGFFSGISKKMLLWSIIVGLAYGVAGEVMYRFLADKVPSIVLTLIYFTGLFIILGIALYIFGKASGNNKFRVLTKAWILSFVLILACSVLFEFIYDVIKKKDKKAEVSSYLFVIDDSGSMLDSDPEGLRYESIRTLLADKPDDFEFCVVGFSNDPVIVRPMGPISDGVDFEESEPWGGTEIKKTMTYIGNEIKKGNIPADKTTKVVLLSDGQPTDVMLNGSMIKALDYFIKNGITVSTVGLLHADDSFMEMVASKTGGVYVRCDNVDDLNSAMIDATKYAKEYRNLLGYRTVSYFNVLLGILRVLFVGALGLIIAIEKTAVCDIFVNPSKVWISSSVCGVLAGLCIELGMNVLGINPTIMRIFTCLLLALTIIDANKVRSSNDDGLYKQTGYNEEINWG